MTRRNRKTQVEPVVEPRSPGMARFQLKLLRVRACGVILVLLAATGCVDPLTPTTTVAAVATTNRQRLRAPIDVPAPVVPPLVGPTPVFSTWYAALYCGNVPLEDDSLTKYADRVIASDGDGASVAGGYKMCGNIPVAVRVRGNTATVQVYETEIRLTFVSYRDGRLADGRVLAWAEPDTYTETIEPR